MRCDIVFLLLVLIGYATGLPMVDSKDTTQIRGKRQWDTTCSYWRWSKCRAKIAAPSIVKKGIDSDQSNNHDFDRLDDDLNSIANNMPNQRAENFRTRNTIAQKVVSKRRALIRAAYKLVYGQK